MSKKRRIDGRVLAHANQRGNAFGISRAHSRRIDLEDGALRINLTSLS